MSDSQQQGKAKRRLAAADHDDAGSCVNCGRQLILQGGVRLCPNCNTRDLDASQIFIDSGQDSEFLFIECPGATLYDPETGEVTAGVEWTDDNDPSKGHRIVDHPVYAPTHTHRRRIKREAYGKIRRCQGCQDFTIRMRRKEGPDFFVPSSKHPGRTKLKSVEGLNYEPR